MEIILKLKYVLGTYSTSTSVYFIYVTKNSISERLLNTDNIQIILIYFYYSN